MICKVSLIRRETIIAFNEGKGKRETTFLLICLSESLILCSSFVLHERKKSQPKK